MRKEPGGINGYARRVDCLVGRLPVLAAAGLATCLAAAPADAASRIVPTLRAKAVGVAYLESQTRTEVVLRVVFPLEAVDIDRSRLLGLDYKSELAVGADGLLVLFDERGRLAMVRNANPLRLVFWCENDGGTQHRPEMRLRLPRARLARPLRVTTDLQNVAAFVAFLRTEKDLLPLVTRKAGSSGPGHGTMRIGDLDADGKPEVIVHGERVMEAGCGGEPRNDLAVTLRAWYGAADLRCCGP